MKEEILALAASGEGSEALHAHVKAMLSVSKTPREDARSLYLALDTVFDKMKESEAGFAALAYVIDCLGGYCEKHESLEGLN